jgi:hypothetical protein
MDPRFVRIEVTGSRKKLIGLCLLAVIMTGISAMVAFGTIAVDPGSFEQAAGWLGTLFFGAALLTGLRRIATAKRADISLSEDGFHDRRVTANPVPWDAIEGVSTWSMSGQKIMVLSLSPEAEAKARPTWGARMARGANAMLGADGLCISATGMSISHDDLVDAVLERLDAARVATI